MPKTHILIVEDESLIALGLALAAEDAGAEVVGPVATVAEAMVLLHAGEVHAAVLDANLLDGLATPVASHLTERSLPFVVHSAIGLPDEIAAMFPHAPLIRKPARPEHVVGLLIGMLPHGG